MTSSLNIETISNDNDFSLFRSQRIKTQGKVLVTPAKTLDVSRFKTGIILNSRAHGINEIYRQLEPGKISSLNKEPTLHDGFSKQLKNLRNKSSPTSLDLCMIKYKAFQFPNLKEKEFLTDVAHSYSDITPIPMLDIKIDSSNFPEFLKYVKSSLDIIEELNDKQIMGYLPNLPRELYPNLLDFYKERGISCFYFDFNGQTPDHLKLRPVLRHLNKTKVLSKSLILGINAKPGKVLKNAPVIPAKDFIAYGYGLDILGETHVGLKASKDFYEKMRTAIYQQQINKRRVFIKSDYGLYQVNTARDVESIYPQDTGISLDEILADHSKDWLKLFNMEQQGIEASEIRKRLNELDAKESVLKYVDEKTTIKKEMKHFQLSKKGIT